MSVYRIHLKPGGITDYAGILKFCCENKIIGTGWGEYSGRSTDLKDIRKNCNEPKNHYADYNSMYKAIHAMSGIKTGDFIWTREGGKDTNYYLFKVGDKLWKDRQFPLTDDQKRFGVENCVSADFVSVGTQDLVPGHVVNSFRATATIQHVYGVDEITAMIWNKNCTKNQMVKESKIDETKMWKIIGNEELECAVILYLQSLGYYVYSSTLKADTKTYECVMIHNTGSHKCFVQVKQGVQLLPSVYAAGIDQKDKIYLFSSNEDYGNESISNVETLSKKTIWEFMKNNYNVMPGSIRYWIDFISE